MKKLAVVTGANRGLGLALVKEFSEGGWSVIALSRSPQPQDAGADVSDVSDVVTVRHDVRSNDASELLEALNDRPVDLLINNAAQGAPQGKLGCIPAEGVLNAVDVNAAGPPRLVQFLLPNLLAAPDPIVINMTSRLGSLAAQASGTFAELNTSYAYKISEAAQNMLTIALAQDLQGRVRCWAVHPGKLARRIWRGSSRCRTFALEPAPEPLTASN
jgi:NAD(P)-dependent dehydrogenase (short-subunit alcohol dehydrogenase family)